MKKSTVQMIGFVVVMVAIAVVTVYGKDIMAAIMSSFDTQTESMLDQILR